MGLHLYITSTILQENAFQFQGPPVFFSALAHGFGFSVWFTVQVQAYAIGSGTAVWCAGIWILDVRLTVAVRLRLTACRLYSICTRRIRWRSDNISEFKIYKMSNPNFQNKTFFQIYYCSKHKLYDFTILNSKTKKVIYHYHFANLNDINKLIQQYK